MIAGEILPHFQGGAVHDHWSSYLKFDNCTHYFCNSHHLRELQFVLDQYQQPWAAELSQLLLDIKAEVEAMPVPTLALPAERLAYFDAEQVLFAPQQEQLLSVPFAPTFRPCANRVTMLLELFTMPLLVTSSCLLPLWLSSYR